MSYDAYIKIDTGGEELVTVEEIGNYTSNVSGMFAEALGIPIRELSGKNCARLTPVFEKGIQRMKENPDRYKIYNPPNGWGSYDGALAYLESILAACKRHPKAVLVLSY